MRTTVTLFIFLSVCGLGIAIAAYNYHTPETKAIAISKDVTQWFLAKPDTNEILSLFDLNGANRWNGGVLHFSDITDVSLNKVTEIKLEPANAWLSNELERDKEVKKFQEGITVTVDNASKDTIGRKNSSVYLNTVHQLQWLSESKANEKIFILYSDLMENNPNFSFYPKENFRLLQSDPDSIEKIFEKREPLPSLNGIEIFLIHESTDATSDVEYQTVSKFYKELFESKGATVHVSANLFN